jgi:hypothetical protein
MDKPIFCTLTEKQMVERRFTVLESLKRKVKSVQRTTRGFSYTFPYTLEMSSEVQRAVALEQECCAFLTFKTEESEDSIRLEITGPDEAIQLIKDYFGEHAE